jgi:hypothetical protein
MATNPKTLQRNTTNTKLRIPARMHAKMFSRVAPQDIAGTSLWFLIHLIPVL